MTSVDDQPESDNKPAKWHLGRWLLLGLVLAVGVYWWATSAPDDQGGVVPSVWLHNPDEAVAKATASGKPILVNFTGSDWCDWCIRLKKEVFDTGIFAAWAADQVILLECDFPRARTLPAELAAQNERIAQRFGISGFPTVLLVTAQGKEIARTGYRRGGAAAWIAYIETTMGRGTVTP